MVLFEGPDNLDDREKYAQNIMVNIFNPVLKQIFAEADLDEFKKFGFNSCIQTGVFAGFILKTLLLPDYEVSAYKGQFVEKMEGHDELVPYMHCFNVATKYGRNILIDLSRTEKPLLFHKTGILEYPMAGKYKNMAMVSKERINIDEYVMMKEGEYFTGIQPAELVLKIVERMRDLSLKTIEEQAAFAAKAYKDYTHLLDI